ncbi:hypothetical protein MC885_012912 [Smutsia gigantea]|nr:hypothetical protein MC885_012912 [Smutsia gigantea]
MAAPAAGPDAPLFPDELLPKGDAEKTEEELEEEDDEEVLQGFSRAALWIGTTSFMILVLPVVFETEKLQMEQQQQLQQRQILLGPNTGLSAGMPGALPSLPGKI